MKAGQYYMHRYNKDLTLGLPVINHLVTDELHGYCTQPRRKTPANQCKYSISHKLSDLQWYNITMSEQQVLLL